MIEDAQLLGAPFISSTGLEECLQKKLNMLHISEKRMKFLPAHDALFLLTKAISSCRVNYLLRTAECGDSPTLIQYDEQLRSLLSVCTNIQLSDIGWSQA